MTTGDGARAKTDGRFHSPDTCTCRRSSGGLSDNPPRWSIWCPARRPRQDAASSMPPTRGWPRPRRPRSPRHREPRKSATSSATSSRRCHQRLHDERPQGVGVAHCACVPCRPSAFTWQPLRGSRRSIPVPKRNHAETLTHRADLQGGHTHRRRGGKRRQAQYAVSVIRPAPHKGSTWPR